MCKCLSSFTWLITCVPCAGLCFASTGFAGTPLLAVSWMSMGIRSCMDTAIVPQYDICAGAPPQTAGNSGTRTHTHTNVIFEHSGCAMELRGTAGMGMHATPCASLCLQNMALEGRTM